MTTLLIDFNNLAVRNYCTKEIEFDTESPNIFLWKYLVVESIYKMLFKEDITEVILAVDDKRSWRKIYWERYKESRKGKRDTSKINWDIFHAEYRKFSDEIKRYLPFKILLIENAEADDVIGVLARKDDRQYIVVSNDEDYLQLISENVRVYNPSKGVFMECKDPEMFVIKKCLTGQSKDDIFNIKTPLNWPQGKRKPGFGDVSAQKVIEQGYQKWLIENKLEERFKINRILIDFNKIPNTIKTRILNTYNRYKLADPSNMYAFFDKNKMLSFLEDFSTVESKLLQLYN
jgi:5'-3' exonuclease